MATDFCDDSDDGCYRPFIEVTRKARTSKTCTVCGEAILPGDMYGDGKGLYDGKWDRWKRCTRCEKIYRHLKNRFDAAKPGDINFSRQAHFLLDCGDTYAEVWGEEPSPEIAALAFALPGDAL